MDVLKIKFQMEFNTNVSQLYKKKQEKKKSS